VATLTLIGEPFPDADAAAHAAAARDLARAVAVTAPRGCSGRLLIARDRPAPQFDTALAQVEAVPLRATVLTRVWRSGTTARPLDGEFVHAPTPLVPLRSRREEDGSQTSVLVPHALAWQAPELMGPQLARQYRAFVKRAVRLADALLVGTHATATALQEHYGAQLPVQVLPLAPPTEYLPSGDASARRDALGLPARYWATTAPLGEHGRLGLLFEALSADPSLPPLVVLTSDSARDQLLAAVPEQLRERVSVVAPGPLAEAGAVLGGAALLAMPQAFIGAGYEVLGALACGVPVVHAGCCAVAELALDAGVAVAAPEQLGGELSRLLGDAEELDRLRVLALDRARSFSWEGTAWQLWELHANL
jgi:glycosyltransferase involved in cell wall biosynthesis